MANRCKRMTDFSVCDEGNLSYIPKEQNEKDDIHLSDDLPRIRTQSQVKRYQINANLTG